MKTLRPSNTTDDSQPSVYELQEYIGSLKIGHGRLMVENATLRAEMAEREAELKRVIAGLRSSLTTISQAQQNAVSFRNLREFAKNALLEL